MGLQDANIKFRNLTGTLGKRAVNAIFPNDVEIYIFALELTNSREQTKEYFVFPINPSSFQEQLNSLSNVKKTAGGISVQNNDSFVPSNISLNGNFGRQFKILLGSELISFSAIRYSTLAGDFGSQLKNSVNSKSGLFSTTIKTGYGCCKILEAIIEKSKQLDEFGKPHSLYFYNLAFNHNYLVKVTEPLVFSMSMENNMVWNYGLKLISIARVEDLPNKKGKQLAVSLTQGVQKLANNHFNNLKKILSNAT